MKPRHRNSVADQGPVLVSRMTETAMPAHFFKYTSFATASIVLASQKLWWSTPSLLNDPFDMRFDLHMDIDPAELRVLVKAQFLSMLEAGAYSASKRGRQSLEAGLDSALDNALATLEQSLGEMHAESRFYTDRTKILCLTIAPDNMLMWAHYAQQHFGAVLRFTTAGESNAFHAARPVTYTDDMPRFLDTPGFAKMILGGSIDTPETIRKQIFTKAAAWEYEREWRISFGLCRDPTAAFEDLKFGETELDGLILGCRMPIENRAELIGLARRLNRDIEILEAVPAPRAFRMEIRSSAKPEPGA